MKERLKKVRKQNPNNTQTKFAAFLGTTRAAIASYELGRVTPSDTFIQLLCAKCNVNETWLRTGEGEMFMHPDSFSLDDYAKKNNLTPLELDIIKGYMELDKATRSNMLSYFKSIFDKHSEVAATIESDPSITRPPVHDGKLTREQKEALMRQEFDAEEKGETSLASTSENGSDRKNLA